MACHAEDNEAGSAASAGKGWEVDPVGRDDCVLDKVSELRESRATL